MATATTQPARIETAAHVGPLVRWHLLSLDAPTIASLWTLFIARAYRVHLPAITVAAMFCAVWALYAADRLLDARTFNDLPRAPTHRPLPTLEARHLFHHRYRTRFISFILLAVLLMAFLIPRLNATALRLFAAEGLLLAGWFLTLHASPFSRYLPKELALGAFFAAAVCIPTAARISASPLLILPGALLFAMVCSLNCLFIYRWESSFSAETAHASTRFAARYTTALAAAIIIAGTAFACASHALSASIPIACALACIALWVLDSTRNRFHRSTLRAAADLALLTPLLLLPFTR